MMKLTSLLLWATAVFVLLTSTSCAPTPTASTPPPNEDFHIVTTTTQATDLTRILTAGVPGIRITPLMGAGVDPHLYQPTEADVLAMNQAQMIIYSGLHLEGQFDAVFNALGEQGVIVHSLGEPLLAQGKILSSFAAAEAGVNDPHFWFDARNWADTAVSLAATLAQIDPTHADQYQSNANAYAAQLHTLHDWADSGLRSIPEAQRYLVTSHDAFQYFGMAHGWRMAAIQGLSTQDEAGVGDMQSTVDLVLAQGVPVLFVESSLPSNSITAVREAINAQGGNVRLGVRELYSDAMDEPGTFAGSYIGMYASNVYTILHSYQCAGVPVQIPPWPETLTPVPPADILNPTCGE
jgi:manganese/zinc/iron transport system substrate-binding protein